MLRKVAIAIIEKITAVVTAVSLMLNNKELNVSSFNVRYDQQRKITNIKIGDLKRWLHIFFWMLKTENQKQ